MRKEGWESGNVGGCSERLNHVEVEECDGPPHSFRLPDQFVEVEIRNFFGKPGVEGVNGFTHNLLDEGDGVLEVLLHEGFVVGDVRVIRNHVGP